jgi:hypothetical protein
VQFVKTQHFDKEKVVSTKASSIYTGSVLFVLDVSCEFCLCASSRINGSQQISAHHVVVLLTTVPGMQVAYYHLPVDRYWPIESITVQGPVQ